MVRFYNGVALADELIFGIQGGMRVLNFSRNLFARVNKE